MTATHLAPRTRAIVAGVIAALAALAVIGATPTSAHAQQELDEGVQEVEEGVDDGGSEQDPTEELEGQEPPEELDGGEDVQPPDDGEELQPPDGGEGEEGAEAQQVEDALAGLEEAVNDALGDSADEGGQEECATALESFFGDPAQESFEGAVETCLAAIDEDVELDDETLQACEAAFEGFLSDPNEETLQAGVDGCIQALQDLVDSSADGGDSEPDGGAQPGENGGGGQVDHVPGAVQTGGTGIPTDGAHAGAALALFAGLTAAGTLAGRRSLRGGLGG